MLSLTKTNYANTNQISLADPRPRRLGREHHYYFFLLVK